MIAGRFQLEAEQASGGMGQVYRARDRQTGAVVAVKMLQLGSGLEAERFAVARGSLVEPAEDLLSDAEIVMILGTAPVAGNGAANEVDGGLVAAGLMCKHAEKV